MMDDKELEEFMRGLEEYFLEMEKDLYTQEVTSTSHDKRRPNLRVVKPQIPESD